MYSTKDEVSGGLAVQHYDACFNLTVNGKRKRATIRVCRRRWSATLLLGWQVQLVGPLAIGFHLADLRPGGLDGVRDGGGVNLRDRLA